jgi:conjugative transposon TraJ protein
MFETLLYSLKEDMLPLCSDMSTVAKALGVLGCMTSMSITTLKAISEVRYINFHAYLKPLTLGMCIMSFQPLVIGVLDGIMLPVGDATSAIARMQEVDYYAASDRLEDEMAREYPSPDVIYHIRGEGRSQVADGTEGAERIEEDDLREIARRELAAEKEYRRSIFTSLLESFLNVVSAAARMIINLVGTFYLILLAILGPLAFAASCFPVFGDSWSAWMSRYISTSLWLPIANLFTAVLSRANLMLCEEQTEAALTTGVVNNTILLAMTIVGIFGYFSVPSVANWVVQAGGSGSYTRNMTSAGSRGLDSIGKGAKTAAAGVAGRLSTLLKK